MQGNSSKGGPFSSSKSKAKLLSEDDVKTTFDDVAGCDEAKERLNEIHEELIAEYDQFDNWNYHDMAAKLLDMFKEK